MRCRRCAPQPIRPQKAASTTDPTDSGRRKGTRKLVASSKQSHDEEIQRRLWQVSEELTGVTYPV